MDNIYWVTRHQKNPEDFFSRLFEEFSGYTKTLSMIFLRLLGIPMLDFIIATKWDQKVQKEIKRFAHYVGKEKLLFRHDKKNETPPYPRGGQIYTLAELKDVCIDFFQQNRIILLMEPYSRFNNSYNINAYIEDHAVQFEIMGPGFDASDLQRGDLSPHETIKLDEAYRIISHSIMGSQQYQKSRIARLQKIQAYFSYNIPVFKTNDIHNMYQYLNLQNDYFLPNDYTPIPDSKLKLVIENIRKIKKERGFFFSESDAYVVSFSFLDSGSRLNAWDITFPTNKYYIHE